MEKVSFFSAFLVLLIIAAIIFAVILYTSQPDLNAPDVQTEPNGVPVYNDLGEIIDYISENTANNFGCVFLFSY